MQKIAKHHNLIKCYYYKIDTRVYDKLYPYVDYIVRLHMEFITTKDIINDPKENKPIFNNVEKPRTYYKGIENFEKNNI